MAYNSNKGPQHSGDIQFEGDPNDVQIDFENDQVSLKAGGVNRLTADSGSVSISGSLTASANLRATGDIHATNYYGNGSNLSGIAGAASGSARLYSSTGIETSGFLKVSGSSTITTVSGTTAQFTVLTASQIVGGSPISISASSITFTGSVEFSGSSTISASSATLTSLTASAISGGSPIEIFGDTVTIVGDGGIALRGPVSSSGGIIAVGSITSSADIVATGSVFVAQGQFLGTPERADLIQMNDGNIKVNGLILVTDGLSGSNIMHNVGNATFGGTVTSTGSMTAAGMFTTSLSASSISQLVGSISSSGDVAVSGNIHATEFHGDGSYLTGISAGAVSGAARVYSVTGLETSGFLKVSGSSVMEGITANGITNVGAYSGSGVLVNVGSISSSANLAVSGNVHATEYWGDGSNLTGISAGATSGSARVYSTTGLETSGYLKVSGSSTLNAVSGTTAQFTTLTASQIVGGSPLSISASSISFSGSVEFSGSSVISASSATLTSLTASAISGGSPIEIVGDTVTLIGDGGINMLGIVSSSNIIRTSISLSASVDVAVTGAVHAANFYGDGSGLTNVSAGAPTSLSGTTAQLTTGVETSGFLKVSGSSKFVAPITASSGINISNNNASASFGPKALEIYWNGTNGVLESEVGHLNIRVNQAAKDIRLRMGDAAGSSQVEFRTNADANVATVDSNGKISGSSDLEIVGNTMIGGTLAVSGSTTLKSALSSSSTLQIVGTTVLGNNLNVSGSTVMEGLSANVIANVGLYSGSSTINSVGSISSSANLAVSGNVHAAVFHGSAAGLTSLPSPTSISGTTAQLTTGVETSGFLKVSGSAITGPFRSEGKIERTVHAYIFGANTAHFIPQFGSTTESANGDYRHQFIAPFNGNLRRVLARSKNNPNGNCTAKVAVASDGTEDFNAAGASAEVEAQTISITAANTTGTFNFSGSQHFTAGQIVGVQMTFNQNPADVNITCIWEYDDRSV